MVWQRIGTRVFVPIKARAKLGLLASALLNASYCNLQSCEQLRQPTAGRTVHWKHCKAREPRSTAGSVLGVEHGHHLNYALQRQ